MDTFDFVIIGAGPAGEAAAFKARELGASVAIVDRRWFGGSCPHIGCLPSKSLLHGAARHHANPAALLLARGVGASRLHGQPAGRRRRARRREPRRAPRGGRRGRLSRDGHGSSAAAGSRSATTARPTSSRRATSSSPSARSRSGRRSPGLDDVPTWTNREATLARELPQSLLVLGGGPTGCELAQVYARFGVPTTIVQSGARLTPTDHPRNSEAVARRRSSATASTSGSASGRCVRAPAAGHGRRPRHRPRRRLDRRGPRDPARGRAGVPARRPRPRALRHRHERADAVPARRPAADRRRAVGHRRPGRARAPHPPGPLPGRARGPDGARRGRHARLPRPAAGDLHGSRGGVRSG